MRCLHKRSPSRQDVQCALVPGMVLGSWHRRLRLPSIFRRQIFQGVPCLQGRCIHGSQSENSVLVQSVVHLTQPQTRLPERYFVVQDVDYDVPRQCTVPKVNSSDVEYPRPTHAFQQGRQPAQRCDNLGYLPDPDDGGPVENGAVLRRSCRTATRDPARELHRHRARRGH